MTNERPILFQTEMVQAILAGPKTQTRRLTDLEPVNEYPDDWEYVRFWDGHAKFWRKDAANHELYIKCRYGNPGDLLWVRETWQTTYITPADRWDYIYKADGGYWIDEDGPMRWKPSIHMPKTAARIWLKITDIQVERLQDIIPLHAIREGIHEVQEGWVRIWAQNASIKFRDYTAYRKHKRDIKAVSPVLSFRSLWECINGRDSWLANPWVWVVSFEVISTTGRPDLPGMNLYICKGDTHTPASEFITTEAMKNDFKNMQP